MATKTGLVFYCAGLFCGCIIIKLFGGSVDVIGRSLLMSISAVGYYVSIKI